MRDDLWLKRRQLRWRGRRDEGEEDEREGKGKKEEEEEKRDIIIKGAECFKQTLLARRTRGRAGKERGTWMPVAEHCPCMLLLPRARVTRSM